MAGGLGSPAGAVGATISKKASAIEANRMA